MCILQCLGYCPKSYVRVLTQSDTLTIAREKAAKALKEKGETPEELLRSIKENEAAVAEAQRTVDAWKAIVGEKSRREEAAKAEAERKAAEERERAEKEEKARIEAEKAEEEARVEAERKAEEERKTKEEERKERDENGQPFVVSSDGTTTFGEITEDTGLTAAPIKLSEGMADEKGNGYGLRHIEARHGDQIRKAGFSSVEEFIEQVAKNYDVIKEGSDRNGNKTYRLLLTDKHNNTLMIELSKDGSYWNVNTAGVFKKSYGKDKKEVYNRHTTVKQSAETAETSQADEHSGTQSTSRMNVPTTSADKGTTLPADQQTSDKENTKKVADSEGENTLKAKIEAASADVNTEPTEAQKEAGNYKKGHVQVGTFDITIEQPEGSIRRGTDADGKKWEIKMHNTYGYFRGTEGVDGDHIDVFLSNDIDGWNGRKVFVVDQYNPDGTFDEHKVMLGFNDMDEAKSDYLANYEKGWENGRRITVSTTNLEDFEKWIDSSHRKTKPFSEYSSVNKETVATDKGSEKAEKKQKKQSVFDKAKEIADKEEKKRKADKPKQKPLTEAERKDAEEVAGALGYRVEWVDTMEENGTIDADKKVIRIAKDAENPLVQVLGHEVTHGVKRMDGGKFKALQKAAMEVAGEKEWNERIKKKRKLNAYAEGKLAEEVTCDIVGEALNDKEALKRLAESLRGERGILARLRDAVVRMVEYFKNRGDKEGVRRMKAADKLLAEFESALKEGVAPEQVKPEGVDRSVREGRSEKTELTAEERELRDNLVERMRKGGLDVVTDSEEMQRVIDTENERTRMMGAGSVREHRVYHGSGADFDVFDHSHMGEGEGAQAYGWGTYVTEVEGIGKTYANATAHNYNNALRPLERKKDSILTSLRINGSELDKARAGLRNAVRFKTKENYEEFLRRREEIEEKYGKHSTQYDDYLWNSPYAAAVRAIEHYENEIKERETELHSLQKDLEETRKQIENIAKEFPRHLYTVEIPDDNGSNYLDWNGHPTESLLKDVGSFLESNGFERVQDDNPVRYEKGKSTVVLNPNATGADLYAELQEALGSDKKASQALAELGCIGIKYPADNMRGGRKDGAKNYVIFNENDAKITDHTRFLRTAGGEVYGLVKDGRIYLDPKVATSETAVHEYTHLWGDMLRRKDSEQWSHTVKELKDSVLWEEVKESYPELKTDDEIADEVLSTFSGRRGAERLREEARRVADGEGGVFTKAKAIETLERVKEAIARFWEGVARMFGINRYRSAEELADMAMRDLINGVKPTSRTFTFDNFYKDTKAVFEGTERPEGKPDYTSYSGSEYWYGEDKGGKYVVRGSDHWSGEFKVKDGERTNVGRNHYSEITEDGMLPIGAQGSLKFGWEKGLSKPVGSGISAAIDRRGSGDSNNIASCYWYIDNAKEKDNKGFTYGKAYLSEFEDKERRRDIPGDDWRDIQGLEGGTRAMAERIAEQPVEEINNRFNEELEKYQNNELPKGHRFELGMPSAELQSAGFPTLPISMRSSLLAKKAGAERHPFAPTDLRDLVNAIQKPIAIFNYSKNNMRNLIVDVSRGGKHFLVGVTLNYKADNIEINSVSGLFPKENHEWIKWIQDGKVLRIDQKEKVQDLINSLRTNPAESERIGLNLDDVAKKVKDFENPKLFDGKISEVDKKGSDSIDRSVRENPKNEDKPRFSRKPGESIFDYASRVSEDVDRSVRERVSARDEYEKKVKSKGFQTKEALQNSMLGLQEFMSAIDHASGNKRYIEDIPDFENPILGENRLSSVNKEESHSRLDAVHSPTPTKGVMKPYLRSYTMIYMPIPSNVSGS